MFCAAAAVDPRIESAEVTENEDFEKATIPAINEIIIYRDT